MLPPLTFLLIRSGVAPSRGMETTYYPVLPFPGLAAREVIVTRTNEANGADYDIRLLVIREGTEVRRATREAPAEGGVETVRAYFTRRGCWVELALTEKEQARLA